MKNLMLVLCVLATFFSGLMGIADALAGNPGWALFNLVVCGFNYYNVLDIIKE